MRDYDADLPRIEAIPGELNQVWTNLIDNAIDAMDGSGTLRISTRAEPDVLVVEIGDTGPGMPPEVQARAFEPFFTTKEVGRGTGPGPRHLAADHRRPAPRHASRSSRARPAPCCGSASPATGPSSPAPDATRG